MFAADVWVLEWNILVPRLVRVKVGVSQRLGYPGLGSGLARGRVSQGYGYSGLGLAWVRAS